MAFGHLAFGVGIETGLLTSLLFDEYTAVSCHALLSFACCGIVRFGSQQESLMHRKMELEEEEAQRRLAKHYQVLEYEEVLRAQKQAKVKAKLAAQQKQVGLFVGWF